MNLATVVVVAEAANSDTASQTAAPIYCFGLGHDGQCKGFTWMLGMFIGFFCPVCLLVSIFCKHWHLSTRFFVVEMLSTKLMQGAHYVD